MRHFLRFGSIAALSLGMGMTTTPAGLVAAPCGTHGVLASLIGAQRRAVAVAAIAVTADDDGSAAAGAEVASSGSVHWQSGPMG